MNKIWACNIHVYVLFYHKYIGSIDPHIHASPVLESRQVFHHTAPIYIYMNIRAWPIDDIICSLSRERETFSHVLNIITYTRCKKNQAKNEMERKIDE